MGDRDLKLMDRGVPKEVSEYNVDFLTGPTGRELDLWKIMNADPVAEQLKKTNELLDKIAHELFILNKNLTKRR